MNVSIGSIRVGVNRMREFSGAGEPGGTDRSRRPSVPISSRLTEAGGQRRRNGQREPWSAGPRGRRRTVNALPLLLCI